jgi:hypothetical protein
MADPLSPAPRASQDERKPVRRYGTGVMLRDGLGMSGEGDIISSEPRK